MGIPAETVDDDEAVLDGSFVESAEWVDFVSQEKLSKGEEKSMLARRGERGGWVEGVVVVERLSFGGRRATTGGTGQSHRSASRIASNVSVSRSSRGSGGGGAEGNGLGGGERSGGDDDFLPTRICFGGSSARAKVRDSDRPEAERGNVGGGVSFGGGTGGRSDSTCSPPREVVRRWFSIVIGLRGGDERDIKDSSTSMSN